MRRNHTIRERWLASILSAAVTALVVGVALALAGGEQGSPETASVGHAVPTELAAAVGAFREPQEGWDKLPPSAVEGLELSGDAQPGEDVTQARRLDLPGGADAHIWPKTDGLCFGSPGPSGCVSTDLLLERGALLGTRFRYTATQDVISVGVFGLVTDGIDESSARVRRWANRYGACRRQWTLGDLQGEAYQGHMGRSRWKSSHTGPPDAPTAGNQAVELGDSSRLLRRL